ncbi:hypothetical protein HY449_00185 [Candidatus Pacearchaeota archaeon]|nr:hypothetical protein [Candidatus Pacearchaeota archaeon]
MTNPEGEQMAGNPILEAYTCRPNSFSGLYNCARIVGNVDLVKLLDDEIARIETPIQKIIRLNVTNGRRSYSPILVSRDSRESLDINASKEEIEKIGLNSWLFHAQQGYSNPALEIFNLLDPNLAN